MVEYVERDSTSGGGVIIYVERDSTSETQLVIIYVETRLVVEQ